MPTSPKVLGLIPARGGSKGILRKNIQMVASQPLMAWTAIEAKKATKLDRLVISTDAEEFAVVAKQHNIEVPFLRPTELAQDRTPSEAVAVHMLRWLEEHENYKPDYLLYLQPTSPLRTANDIDASIAIAQDKNADAVLSVSSVVRHPYFMKTVGADGRLEHFMEQKRPVPQRQELSPLYALNGAIFLIRREVMLQRQDWYGDKNYAYVMEAERSLEIDTPWELKLADLILREKNNVC